MTTTQQNPSVSRRTTLAALVGGDMMAGPEPSGDYPVGTGSRVLDR